LVKPSTFANLYNDGTNIISGIGGTFTTDVIFKSNISSDQVIHTSINTITEVGAIGGSLNIASLVRESAGIYKGTLTKALDDYTLASVLSSINRDGSSNRAISANLISNTQFEVFTVTLSAAVVDEKFTVSILGGINV